jgi:putative dimethyl sulfoxide reductase chaperone
MTVQTNIDAESVAFSKLALISMARANVFRLLASFFYDPTQEVVEQLISGSYISELNGYYNDLVSFHHSGVDALEPLKKYHGSLSTFDLDEMLKELKVEYARLFIGPGTPVAQPYETFYNENMTSESQPLLMISPAAMAVEKAYRDAGVEMSKQLREPPDHFAVELEFLYFLSKKESDSWTEGNIDAANKWRRTQLAFIDGHLGCWSESFCNKIREESTHPFYRALAYFSDILLKLEGSNPANVKSRDTRSATVIKKE